MFAGKPPFAEPSAPETLNAIINKPAPPIAVSAGADFIPELERVIAKCLPKDPEARYPSMEDVVNDLRAARHRLESRTVSAVSESPPSIAVLPFTDMSPEKDQDYFCEGMAEEIINALTKVEGLRVAARTSAFQFKGQAQDARHIGEALNVKTLLEGSVRTAGNRLRVTAQLINTEDGYHLWSERYDRQMEDVFDIQDEIAESIVGALRGKLVGDVEVVQEHRSPENLEAYHLYLRGRYYRFSKYNLEKARQCYDESLEKDPQYAPALGGLADSYCFLAVYGFLPPKVAFPKVKAAVDRALTIEGRPTVSSTEGLLLTRFFFDWDWDGAEQAAKQLISLNPYDSAVHNRYGYLLACLSRNSEAMKELKLAQKLDPLSPYAFASTGAAFYFAGQYEPAIEACRKSLAMDPSYLIGLYILGACCSQTSRHEEAIAHLQKAVRLTGRSSFMVGLLGRGFAQAGMSDDARDLLRELTERAEREYVSPLYMGWILGELGRIDEAFSWLEKAFEERNPNLVHLNTPYYDCVHSDPRFEDLLRRVNLA
jgi:serine/threonine-protein kinase